MFEKYLKRRKESRNYRTEMLRKLNNKKHICTMQGEIINRCHKQLLILLLELFLWIRIQHKIKMKEQINKQWPAETGPRETGLPGSTPG